MTPECSHPILMFVESYYCSSRVSVRNDGFGYAEDVLDALAEDFYHLDFRFTCPVCGAEFEAVKVDEPGVFRPGKTVTSKDKPTQVH